MSDTPSEPHAVTFTPLGIQMTGSRKVDYSPDVAVVAHLYTCDLCGAVVTSGGVLDFSMATHADWHADWNSGER